MFTRTTVSPILLRDATEIDPDCSQAVKLKLLVSGISESLFMCTTGK